MPLFDQLCEADSLRFAWEQIYRKGAAGGIDKTTVHAFAGNAQAFLDELVRDLRAGTYVPEPYLKVSIPKSQAGFRQLGLPTVRDKIVQLATKTLLEPILEPLFLPCSHAYRRNKSTYKAVQRVRHIIRAEKKTWLVQCDINNFFDNIDHKRLLRQLEAYGIEAAILHLIQLWIGMARVGKDMNWRESKKGLPQGNILSPILSNLFLHPLDQWISNRQWGYVRYADDFVVLMPDQTSATAALKEIEDYLLTKRALRLNPERSVLPTAQGFSFLGITLHGHEPSLKEIQHLEGKEVTPYRNQIMLAEARAAASYWQYLKVVLASKLDFPGREHQQAQDPFNQALNYGYGILYSRIWESVIRARLHTGLSYLHSPGEGAKPSLIFDMIEEFRVQAVDRPIVSMIRKEWIPKIYEGRLEEESRKRIVRHVLKRLSRMESFRGNKHSLQQIILIQGRAVAAYLDGHAKSYRPYIRKW